MTQRDGTISYVINVLQNIPGHSINDTVEEKYVLTGFHMARRLTRSFSSMPPLWTTVLAAESFLAEDPLLQRACPKYTIRHCHPRRVYSRWSSVVACEPTPWKILLSPPSVVDVSPVLEDV